MIKHKLIISSGDKSKSFYYDNKPRRNEKTFALNVFKKEFGKLKMIEMEIKKVNLVKK